MKNVLTTLTKSILIPLGLTTAVSATIKMSIFRSETTALIISNEELEDIMKIVKSLEEYGFLIKGVSETIQNKAKEQKCGFLRILLGIFTSSILGNALVGKAVIRVGEGVIRAAQDLWFRLILQLIYQYHYLTKYYQNELQFDGVYSRNNLPKIKDETYIYIYICNES